MARSAGPPYGFGPASSPDRCGPPLPNVHTQMAPSFQWPGYHPHTVQGNDRLVASSARCAPPPALIHSASSNRAAPTESGWVGPRGVGGHQSPRGGPGGEEGALSSCASMRARGMSGSACCTEMSTFGPKVVTWCTLGLAANMHAARPYSRQAELPSSQRRTSVTDHESRGS